MARPIPRDICENQFVFAITYTLDPKTAARLLPSGLDQANRELCLSLREFGFQLHKPDFYLCNNDDLANLFNAMLALKALPWFSASVRDIRAFRVEQWSDFTSFIKS